MRKLNLGCGRDIRPGWINLDRVALPGVDIVHDLSHLPLPFPDASMEEVACRDVLEHLEYIPVLRDIHRILVPNGRVYVRVPHFTCRDSFRDPTHRRLFSVGTLEFFASDHESNYYFDFGFSRVETRLSFAKLPKHFWYYTIEWWVNRSRNRLYTYESSPMRIFPAMNIEATLVK